MLKSAPMLIRYLAYTIMSAVIVIAVSLALVYRAGETQRPVTVESLGEYYLPDGDNPQRSPGPAVVAQQSKIP